MPRREFLYGITYWEARRILRGYRKRNRLTNQLIAENIYATIFSMRDPKGKTVSDLFPQLFNDDDETPPEPISEEDVKELQDLIASENANNAEKADTT